MGGIRLPPTDVPVATYVSTTLCGLGGLTFPFTDGQLQQRYGTHAEYERQMAVATDRTVSEGWMLPEDAIDLMERVCAAADPVLRCHRPLPRTTRPRPTTPCAPPRPARRWRHPRPRRVVRSCPPRAALPHCPSHWGWLPLHWQPAASPSPGPPTRGSPPPARGGHRRRGPWPEASDQLGPIRDRGRPRCGRPRRRSPAAHAPLGEPARPTPSSSAQPARRPRGQGQRAAGVVEPCPGEVVSRSRRRRRRPLSRERA